ncbi:hypothetical protein [Kerstersia similis]|uniref:hypothetical protein n=1 Tax=Kerstersia similis TaxID=206505 RepID=UPI0039EF2994
MEIRFRAAQDFLLPVPSRWAGKRGVREAWAGVPGLGGKLCLPVFQGAWQHRKGVFSLFSDDDFYLQNDVFFTMKKNILL